MSNPRLKNPEIKDSPYYSFKCTNSSLLDNKELELLDKIGNLIQELYLTNKFDIKVKIIQKQI